MELMYIGIGIGVAVFGFFAGLGVLFYLYNR